MALLRSLFITAFTVYLVVASTYALAQLVRGMEPLLSWLGLGLATLGPLTFFAWILVAKPARTARHPVEYSMISALGLAITMVMAWRHGETAGSIHLWAGIAVAGWFAYLRWYSVFRSRPGAGLAPGDALPEFRLQNLEGETVNSSLFRGKAHVLVFYRGNWCPFCTAQIAELAAHYRQLEAAGATVVLISPQPSRQHRKLAGRFSAPLQFLRDPRSAAARQLGIFDAWGTPMGMQLLGYASGTALPTIIISGEDGRILYSHLADNYRLRPEPAEYLKVLQQA